MPEGCLQPEYPSRFEVNQINVCPMVLQLLDCKAVQRRLGVYLMALQPLNCRAVRRWVAEMPSETAHPIFPQCNRSHTAATTVCAVATLPNSSSSRLSDMWQSVGWPRCWTTPACCTEHRSTGFPRSSFHPICRLGRVMASYRVNVCQQRHANNTLIGDRANCFHFLNN